MLTKVITIAYCALARFFFEFSLPVLCLFMFSKTTAFIVWSAFLLWQLLSWIAIKKYWLKGESENITYAYELWAKALPTTAELDLIGEETIIAKDADEALERAHTLAQVWWGKSYEIRNFRKA